MGNRPPNRPSRGSRRPSYGSGGGQGGGSRPSNSGGGGGGNTGGSRHKGGNSSGCEMWVPVAAVLTLFYAFPRMLWEDWKEKRNA